MKYTQVVTKNITIEAQAGSDVASVAEEAIGLAKLLGKQVTFIHNDTKVTVYGNTTLKQALMNWDMLRRK